MYDICKDASRSLMGSQHENWFYRQLIWSQHHEATWRVIGNQIMIFRINTTSWSGSFEILYNEGQCGGHQANCNRTFKTMSARGLDNNIMLSGELHANSVSDLVWLEEHEYDPATEWVAVGVEFAGTAVSSTGFGGTCQLGE